MPEMGRHRLKVNITETDWQFEKEKWHSEYSEGTYQTLMCAELWQRECDDDADDVK